MPSPMLGAVKVVESEPLLCPLLSIATVAATAMKEPSRVVTPGGEANALPSIEPMMCAQQRCAIFVPMRDATGHVFGGACGFLIAGGALNSIANSLDVIAKRAFALGMMDAAEEVKS